MGICEGIWGGLGGGMPVRAELKGSDEYLTVE